MEQMSDEAPVPITWNQIAIAYPEFVQWVVQTYGPMPEGPIQHEDYVRYKELYENRV